MTNSDRLRQMSDEELLEIVELIDCRGDRFKCPADTGPCCDCDCKQQFLKWLKQEVTNEKV